MLLGFTPQDTIEGAGYGSDVFHSSLCNAIMEIQDRCGGVPSVEETARFLEDLACELRTKHSAQCAIDNIESDRRTSQCS